MPAPDPDERTIPGTSGEPMVKERPTARWFDPAGLPENPLPDGWGFMQRGQIYETSLEEIQTLAKSGPGEILWNGKLERPSISIVAAPGEKHLVAAADRPELRPMLLEANEARLKATLKKSAKLFFPMAALAVVTYFVVSDSPVVSLLFLMFAANGAFPYFSSLIQLRRLRKQPDRFLADLSSEVRYSVWLSLAGNRGARRTNWLVGAWVVVFLAQLVALYRSGALDSVDLMTLGGTGPRPDIAVAGLVKPLVPSEPWRLLTAATMHAGLLHLLMNVLVMMGLSVQLERGIHRYFVALVWLLGAVVGNLASWYSVPNPSLGASGGIAAVFGYLLVTGWVCHRILPPGYFGRLAANLVFMCVLGYLGRDIIDNSAHLGGLITGCAIALLTFCRGPRSLPLQDQAWLTAVGRVSEVATLLVVLFTILQLVLLRS
jgi:membrane associated rhomboid family serine protease